MNTDDSDLRHYINVSEKARDVAAAFNKALSTCEPENTIVFIKPASAYLDEKSDVLMSIAKLFKKFNKRFSKDELLVFEDLLKGKFETFISNEGVPQQNGSELHFILNAFCHFSYHHSNGESLICNLQGVLEGRTYCLTNPSIYSRSRCFGISDKGEPGIATFFRHHKCNRLCEGWSKPCTSETRKPSLANHHLHPSCQTHVRHPTPTAPCLPSYDDVITESKQSGVVNIVLVAIDQRKVEIGSVYDTVSLLQSGKFHKLVK